MKYLYTGVLSFALFFGAMTGAYAAKVNLQTDHGKNLDKASFPLRYKFQKIVGVEWTQSTYSQRKKFLENWYAELEKERKYAAQQKKEEKEKERQIREQRRDEKRAQQEKLRKRRELEKQYKDEQLERQKEFDDRVRERKQEIKDLRMRDKERQHK